MRILRAWAGVRPLYKESAVSDTRDVTRAFVLLDHEQRDGVSGLVTITSGKWTTYRKMAEVTVDLVCAKLGVQRPCTTDQEPLPAPGHAGYHHLGARLAKVEQANAFGELICECELATRQDVERAILEGNAQTIDDIRRDVRLGMGPCQGGFCTFRTAGLLQSLRHPPVQETNAVLRDFLQERWKGLMPILWGQQLRQERLDELIYLSVLNTDHAPGPRASRLKPVLYESPLKAEEPDTRVQASPAPAAPRQAVVSPAGAQLDVLVIGAGLGGLAAGWQACNAGARTRVIAKGWGSLYWNAGCIDVLGYYPLEQEEPVQSPAQALATLIQREPQHPYARAGLDGIVEAIEAFQQLCDRAGYPLPGSLDKNWLLPTALGTFRPTCLAPESMVAGDKSRKGRVLIVGFEHFPDFYPALIAENLSAQGLPSAGLLLDLPLLRQRTFVTGRVLAWMFEQEEGRASVTEAIRLELAKLKPGQSPERVGFPAVLGLNHPHQVWQDMQERLGVPVFEIPTVPPSIPGIRLNTVLIIAIEQAGGRVFDGMQAVAAQSDEAGVTNLLTEAAARQKSNRAKAYVLATGGILGGGVRAAYQGQVREMIFDLPLSAPDSRAAWLQPHFLAPASHPIYRSGVEVDTDFHPLDAAGKVVYPNLYAAGNTLAHAEAIRERSIEGIALATGYLAGLKCARETVTKGHAL
jgi:anaerobic glycerol-3-phosphate dehydrogenase B subunit